MKFRLFFSSFLLANALTLQASERWFEVEMIIFERTGSSSVKEHFPTQVTPIRLGRHIDLLTDCFTFRYRKSRIVRQQTAAAVSAQPKSVQPKLSQPALARLRL